MILIYKAQPVMFFFSLDVRDNYFYETMTKTRLQSRKDDLFIVKLYQEEAFVQLVE